MSGYVYAIGIEATTYIKIGRSVLPKVRMAALQTSMPFKLESLYSLEVDHPARVERALHEMLEGSRVRGQWFEMPEIPLLICLLKVLGRGLNCLLNQRSMKLVLASGYTVLLAIDIGCRKRWPRLLASLKTR